MIKSEKLKNLKLRTSVSIVLYGDRMWLFVAVDVTQGS